MREIRYEDLTVECQSAMDEVIDGRESVLLIDEHGRGVMKIVPTDFNGEMASSV